MSTPEVTGTGRARRIARVGAVAGLALALAVPALADQFDSSTVNADALATVKAKPKTAAARNSIPPNVTFPVAASGKPVDRLTYKRSHKPPATDITAKCGTPVVAAHPGTVRVIPHQPKYGGTLIKVMTSPYKLTTWYGFVNNVAVTDYQIVQAGQPLGVTGHGPRGCELSFQVRDNSGKKVFNPSSWLNSYVGVRTPTTTIFGNTGFLVASFNQLGASHTDPGGDAASRYPSYTVRVPKAIAILDRFKIDVAGLQEFQRRQWTMFVARAGNTYGVYPSNSKMDTDNSIVWRKSAFDLVSANTFPVTYFNGRIRQMPYVQLREKATGRTAYFINVHNPASTRKFPKQEKYRAMSLAQERALVIRLRASGDAVFLTGDLNDRAAAYCPLAEGKLMLSADTVPSMTCAPPAKPWIDWVLGAGPVRFSSYVRDWTTRDQKITDHPIVISRAHLAD